MRVDGATIADVPAVLALNNAAIPAVNALDEGELTTLMGWGRLTVVRAADGGVGAALLTMPPGTSYDSMNYQWFGARYSNFLYVDRIVVNPLAQGGGLGRMLYDETAEFAARSGVERICCEVNTDPPNPGSMVFHARMGFDVLEERLNAQSGKTVAMMTRILAPKGG